MDVGTGVNSKVVSLEEVKDILIIAKKPPCFFIGVSRIIIKQPWKSVQPRLHTRQTKRKKTKRECNDYQVKKHSETVEGKEL